MKLQASILGMIVVAALATPGFAQMAIAQSSTPSVALNSVADDFQQAETAMKNRQYKEAEVLWRSIIKRDPTNAKAYLRLGNVIEQLVATSRSPAAKQAYQQAVALDPKDPDAYLALGPLLSSNRDNEASEQIKLYRQAIKVARPNALLYYTLGAELTDRYGNRVITAAQKDEAIAAFRKAIELDPKQGGFYVALGNALWNRGDGVAGDAALQSGMKLNYVLECCELVIPL